jgi:ribonuclease BN (tRNA processing enzyme)
VTAFAVKHADNIAYGYRFQTADRTIVISGDTSPAESIVENCNGCDVLIHEAYSMFTYNYVTPEMQARRRTMHTSSVEPAEIARRARPGLLILYNRSSLGGHSHGNPEDVLLQEIQAVYHGKVVTGHDLRSIRPPGPPARRADRRPRGSRRAAGCHLQACPGERCRRTSRAACSIRRGTRWGAALP